MVDQARLPTEPLREEHRMLLPKVRGLETLATELPVLELGKARARLVAAVDFLRGELMPHASAEEAVLYPAIEQVTGTPGSMATMSADHREVVRRIEALAVTASSESIAEAPFQLVGLAAIVKLHFQKEEELLLPLLDRALAPEQADELFRRMESHAREAGHAEVVTLH